MFTLPGIAAIYYGDEVGMSGGKEPANRGGMAWSAEGQDARMLELYRRLGSLRRELPELRTGAYERLDGTGAVAAFARGLGVARLVVMANGGDGTESVDRATLEGWLGGPAATIAVIGYEGSTAAQRADGVRLAPRSVTIVGRQDQQEKS
jgi:neopullulanase